MGFVKYLFDIALKLLHRTVFNTFENHQGGRLKVPIVSNVSRLVSRGESRWDVRRWC